MDETKPNTLVVKIAGETINVYAEEGQDYIRRMTDYINSITDGFVAKKGAVVSPQVQLAFAALELCDELFKTRKELDEYIQTFGGEKGEDV